MKQGYTTSTGSIVLKELIKLLKGLKLASNEMYDVSTDNYPKFNHYWQLLQERGLRDFWLIDLDQSRLQTANEI